MDLARSAARLATGNALLVATFRFQFAERGVGPGRMSVQAGVADRFSLPPVELPREVGRPPKGLRPRFLATGDWERVRFSKSASQRARDKC